MRLLVDLSTFTSDHNGGKDEVAYNLLKGFSQLQLTQSIVCVSRDELVEKCAKLYMAREASLVFAPETAATLETP